MPFPVFLALFGVTSVLLLRLLFLLRRRLPRLDAAMPRTSPPRGDPEPSGIRVAVVGAGPSGLVALRELLAAGHDAVAFEAGQGVGGTFAATYDGCLLTTSSTNTAFSSFFPEGEHVMWTAREYVEYLGRFADRFDLWPRIRFGARVESARLAEGRWEVKVSSSRAGDDVATHHFDNLAVCTGVNSHYDLPAFVGQDVFRGRIMHTSEYKSADFAAGRHVLVVGLGESGSDIALEVAKVAKTTALSTRAGPGYVIPRTLMGSPTDMDTNRLYHSIPRWIFSMWVIRFKVWLENLLLLLWAVEKDDFDVLTEASCINVRRGKSVMHRYGTKNTSFIEAVKYHGASYKPGVVRLTEEAAVFDDGSTFECDVIICATGYKVDFPWLPSEINSVASRPRRLFKYTFLPELGSKLAFAGFARPNIGAIPPLAEMQARWFAQVVSGEAELPPAKEMEEEAAADEARTLSQFASDAPRIGGLTDYLTLLDDLAWRVGCQPPLCQLATTDLKTCLKVLCGPLSGPQFRLVGPGATPSEARRALARLPTMPVLVLAYEAIVLLCCKGVHMLGLEQFRPVGLCGGES